MPNPYLGHLMRITGISGGFPPIPWITVDLRISGVQSYTQASPEFMTPSDSTSGQFQGVKNYPGFAPFTNYFSMAGGTLFQFTTLLNPAHTTHLDVDELYPFSLLYFSADIPSLTERASAPLGATDYKKSGTDIILPNGSPPGVGLPPGTVWMHDLVQIRDINNLDPLPNIENFTMNYNNPDPYLGGSFPPGTGTQEYFLESTFISGGNKYARYKPVP